MTEPPKCLNDIYQKNIVFLLCERIRCFFCECRGSEQSVKHVYILANGCTWGIKLINMKLHIIFRRLDRYGLGKFVSCFFFRNGSKFLGDSFSHTALFFITRDQFQMCLIGTEASSIGFLSTILPPASVFCVT